MHVIVKDPETGETIAILCVERTIHSSQILSCNIDHMNEIEGIAFGMKVKELTLIVPQEGVAELLDMGWKESTSLKVMVKTHGK